MMSSRTRTRRRPTQNQDRTDTVTVAPETLLELLEDTHARTILRLLQERALSARELADECHASRPTVYRRLNRLEEAGLVDSSMTLQPDGYHRKEYETDFEHVSIGLTGGELHAAMATGPLHGPATVRDD